MSGERVEWATGGDALERAGTGWDELADQHPDPFMRREWLGPWSRAFAEPEECELCLVWRDGSLVAAAPLLRRGGRLEGMANLHTPVFRPMAHDGEALDTLTAAIGEAGAGALTLTPLPDGEPATTGLIGASRRAGRLVSVELRYDSPVADTCDGYEAYRDSRGKTWMSLERKMRKADRERDVELRLLCAGDDALAFFEDGLRLEAAGWKGSAGTAVLCEPNTATFYREMCAGFARRRELGLSGMWFDGALVAFDLALHFGGRYWGLKSAYAEEERKNSPGLLLAQATVEAVFEQGLTALEMLGSAEPYKDMFATKHRRHVTCGAYRRTPRWTPVWAWRRARPHAKRAYRQLRDWRARER